MGGVVSYSNEAKAELLGVDPALIEAHGAVSEPVAEAMAAGALAALRRRHRGRDHRNRRPGWGNAGKAGRDGLFHREACRRPDDTRTLRLPGDRSDVRERSTTVAMHLLRRG